MMLSLTPTEEAVLPADEFTATFPATNAATTPQVAPVSEIVVVAPAMLAVESADAELD